jgi:hypothetical protein
MFTCDNIIQYFLFRCSFFYLDTGHLLAVPKTRTIIVKESSEAVLPCKPLTSEINVTLYKELFHFEVVSTDSLHIGS